MSGVQGYRTVALRKESVDRNVRAKGSTVGGARSLSARRAWIEIHTPHSAAPLQGVALRKESVDRNNKAVKQLAKDNGGRSPQGERG